MDSLLPKLTPELKLSDMNPALHNRFVALKRWICIAEQHPTLIILCQSLNSPQNIKKENRRNQELTEGIEPLFLPTL